MQDIHQILKNYWGYSSFRPLQEDIIKSVLTNEDTLALLPTGGGKSICFQVPVMAMEGIGIVVSPLIALMNDQVRSLKEKGIPAIALSSNLSYREIDIALENAINDKYKFLYLSPERLQSEIVIERLKRMKVNLLAVDEAHCISQWGYDFRPPYLKIAETKEILKNIPILALTATATPKVVDDIQEKLNFEKKNVFQKSFYRSNLHYNVRKTERKWANTLEIFKKIKGSAIVYARNRKTTVEIADWLIKSGFSADYYHAGLNSKVRNSKQQQWLENRIRIMVCTNAFGMGIDKPDVRLVIHLELPDSLESYFQEAGRAGRDGNTSYSVVLLDPSDVDTLKNRYLNNFPNLAFIKKLYHALGNYFQLALGSGENMSFDFDFNAFCLQYNLPLIKAYQALKILENEGLINLNEGIRPSSRVMFTAQKDIIYDFQLRNPGLDALIKTLARSYGGLDIEYTNIDESSLAQRLKSTPDKISKALIQLKQHGIIDYIKSEGNTQLSFLTPRQKTEFLTISDEHLKHRFEDLEKRITAVVNYVEEENNCRSKILLHYFGEETLMECGECDVCRKNKEDKSNDHLEENINKLLNYLGSSAASLEEIRENLQLTDTQLSTGIRWLLDHSKVEWKGDLLKLKN